MALITNESLLAVNAELERKNNILMRFANKYARTSWLEIRNKVRGGTISETLVVGDELVTTYNYNGTVYDMPWIVVDIDREVEWEDGTKHPGLVLQSKYITIESTQYDNKEDNVVDLTEEPNALEGWHYWGLNGTTYTALNLETGDPIPTTYENVLKCWVNSVNVVKFGYSRWKDSAMRQWLNSNAARGLWWESKHPGDTEPTNLNTYSGFISCLDNDFSSIIVPVKVKSRAYDYSGNPVTDITVDKFYMPAVEEMYGIPSTNVGTVEGPYFPYWKTITGFETPSNSANTARKPYQLDNNHSVFGHAIALRSNFATSNTSALATNGAIITTGSNADLYASSTRRTFVVCVIS